MQASRPVGVAPDVRARAALVVASGLVVGALTSWGQALLDPPFAAFVNSASAWLVAPFLVGICMATRRGAAAAGLSVCVLQLVGYYATAELRGFAAGASAIVALWLVCAIVGGPVWVRPAIFGAPADRRCAASAAPSCRAPSWSRASGSTPTSWRPDRRPRRTPAARPRTGPGRPKEVHERNLEGVSGSKRSIVGLIDRAGAVVVEDRTKYRRPARPRRRASFQARWAR